VFDYEYAEISEILGKSEANCRQLVSRANDRIKAQRPRFEAKPEEVQRISEQFLLACTTGNLQGLVQLLADDVVIYSDGGGKAAAALRPLEGMDRASRFLAGVFKKAPAELRFQPVRVNDQPGFAVFAGEQLVTVLAFAVADGRIQQCYLIRNPEKLARAKVR
jgi:RNA polymerase sigma-70 factor (ECF subfamily)